MASQSSAAATAEKASTTLPEVPADVTAEAVLLDAFSQIASVSKVVAKAVDGQGGLWLTVSYSQRNVAANAMRKYSVTGLVPAGSAAASAVSTPVEQADALLVSPQPDGDQQLVVKAGSEGVSVIHQVWSTNRVTLELHVPKTLHGGLLTGSYFAADVAWHPSGTAVAYIAERPVEERTPVWGGLEAIKDTAGPKGWRGVGTALEDWGELHTGKRAPAVYVLDTQTSAVVKVEAAGLPDGDVSWGQPCWTPGGDSLVLVGWPHHAPNFPEIHKRLGVVFCYNRPAQLWHVPVTRDPATGALTWGAATPITRPEGSAMSPVFTPTGDQLLFLSLESAVRNGTHGGTAQLCALPWPTAASGISELTQPRVVVDVVDRPAPTAFPGLYTALIPDRPFVDNNTLLLNTQWRCQNAIVAVDLTTGAIAPVTPVRGYPGHPDTAPSSYVLAGVVSGRALAIHSSPTSPPQAVIADLPAHAAGLVTPGSPPLAWTAIDGFQAGLPSAVVERLNEIEGRVVDVAPTTRDTSLGFDTLVVAPRQHTGPLPTILMPHGGPHAGITASWLPPYAFLAALGYAVVAPNFRGSTGYGQAALQSLPGVAGQQDVSDCIATLETVVHAGLSDAARVGVVGGSHGGFLSGHLVGQHPDTFKFAVMRNPVTNISLMVGLTDISDWCFVEVWGCEKGLARASAVPTLEDLEAMFRASPIAHVHNVKVPVTLMLGAKDRRVPPPDGRQYEAALRKAGAPARVLVFAEDGHALDRLQTEYEQWINVAADAKRFL